MRATIIFMLYLKKINQITIIIPYDYLNTIQNIIIIHIRTTHTYLIQSSYNTVYIYHTIRYYIVFRIGSLILNGSIVKKKKNLLFIVYTCLGGSPIYMKEN